jgi:hypothetical protein
MSYYAGSMMGSGIYSEEVTLEIVCKERCDDCFGGQPCLSVWNEDFVTDDWGNISQEVTCELCNHKYTIEIERE